MKKIILGVLFGLFFVSSSVFAVGSSNIEQAQYQSILSTLSNLSAQIPVLRNQNKITAQQERSFLTIITNLMSNVIARMSSNPVDNSAKLNISPFIKSIDKSSGSIGTVVTLKGVDLAGFEGDLDAWIENSAGEVGYLPGMYSGQLKTDQIVVKIPERACKQNNSYSGNPCTSYLNITPGMYKLYTSPFGKKSNKVSFEVTTSFDSNKTSAKAFFVDSLDNTSSECGNEFVGLSYNVSSISPLRDIIKILIEPKPQDESALLNPVSKYNLKIEDIFIKKGVATIKLLGKEWDATSSGYCSKYTVYVQLKQTALQFSTVDDVEIYINGENLEDSFDH